MQTSHLVLITALCLQFYNLGTIWFCQIVVYPLFGRVGLTDYIAYHRFYGARIPAPIILPGFASFIMPIAVLICLPATVPAWMAWSNVLCGFIGFLVTVGLEIPRHFRLQRSGKNDILIAQLVLFNWPRTVSISVSAGLMIAMASHAFMPVLANNPGLPDDQSIATQPPGF